MAKNLKMIEIDLEIYRLIETNRLSFTETHAEILRRLLGLKPVDKQRSSGIGMNLGYEVVLPAGTLLKGEYRRAEIQAEIQDDVILLDGEKYNSLSAAAKKFGGPNGWTFWKWVKRPQDSEWMILNELRDPGSIARRRVGVAHINLPPEELADMPD